MRQFANYIHITPAFRVSSIINGTVIMKSGFSQDRFIVHNEVEPAENVNSKPAGPIYTVKVTLYVDKLSESQKAIYAHNAPIIVSLLDVEKSDTVIIGSPGSPAVISFSPGANHDQLLIEYTSKTPIL